MAYGMLGHVGISAQQSFNTLTTSYDYFPVISESLTTNIEQLIEEGMKARFEEGDTQEGLLTVEGDIVFEPHPIMLGHFLRGALGQSSGTLVGSVTTWDFLPRQTDFTAGKVAVPPFTLEVYRDTGESWVFTDAVVNALNMEVTNGAIVKATASMLCRVSSLNTKTTPSFPEGRPWTWDAVSLSIGGAAANDTETLVISIENNLEGIATLSTERLHNRYLRTGHRLFSITGTADFPVQSEYIEFRQQNQRPLVMTATGDTITSSQSNVLKIDVPQFRYTAFPVGMAGPGRIQVSFEGSPKFHAASLTAIDVTLTNTRESYEN